MSEPGDVLIRNLPGSEFELVDCVTNEALVPRDSLPAVLRAAASRGVTVWQQNVDERGRPLGDPVKLLSPGSSHPLAWR